jgi:hypothetical protein
MATSNNVFIDINSNFKKLLQPITFLNFMTKENLQNQY